VKRLSLSQTRELLRRSRLGPDPNVERALTEVEGIVKLLDGAPGPRLLLGWQPGLQEFNNELAGTYLPPDDSSQSPFWWLDRFNNSPIMAFGFSPFSLPPIPDSHIEEWNPPKRTMLNVLVGTAPREVEERLTELREAAEQPPDLTECIVGFRRWNITASGLLQSTAQEDIWLPREAFHARCWSHADCPSEDCDCGIYSMRGPEDFGDAEMGVVGEVYLWGKVIEHEDGYRAEFAYPKELWFFDPNERHVAATYGVPARW